jgi:hypothetical protein
MFKDEEIPIKVPIFTTPPQTEVLPPVPPAPIANNPVSSEIDTAIKQFEVQSSTLAPTVASAPAPTSDLSFMVRLVMKLSGGIIKTRKSAEYVLLFLTIIFFVLSFFISFGSSFFSKKAPAQIVSPKGAVLP